MGRGDSIGEERPLAGLRVCYFGRFDPHYSRNAVTAKCLERAGADIVQVRNDRGLLARTPGLIGRGLGATFDLLIVGFRAHSDMPAARLLASLKRVPLVFDPLVSRFEEKVVDRRLVPERSWLAKWYKVSDRLGCRAATRVLLETSAQADYFAQTFGVARTRFRRLWLGADDEVMRPQADAPPADRFTAFFYGRFSPLHGIEHIIQAASCLERRGDPVRFVLVGAGQTYQMARDLVTRLGVSTVSFVDPVPYAQLAVMMGGADVCLGSFGTTARAARVIPNKVFDALAVGRPVIAADTPGAREALTHGRDAWLCASGSAEAIADSIAQLKREPGLRHSLADNGHRLFRDRFSLDALTRDLVEIVGELV